MAEKKQCGTGSQSKPAEKQAPAAKPTPSGPAAAPAGTGKNPKPVAPMKDKK